VIAIRREASRVWSPQMALSQQPSCQGLSTTGRAIMDRATFLNDLHGRFGLARREVVAVVERATGRTVASTHRLIRGDENEVHHVGLADGSAVYLRASFPGTPPSKMRDEAWAMNCARDAGVPVPVVLAIEHLATDAGDRPAMVVCRARGRQLHEVLPTLSPVQRTTTMAEMGRILAVLHSIPMPGAGLPDEEGVWPDPDAKWRSYIANCLADCEHLAAAGLTPAEVQRVVDVLESSIDQPVDDHPVLCHGDVSPEHVFVDRDLRVAGLIDWGLWHAGSAVSELAAIALTHTPTDLNAVLTGHGHTPTDRALNQAISRHAIARATAHIRWLVSSGQTAELHRLATVLRSALTDLTC
jgi:aminoglycoside phosphotransferase (APT) family kinase protein